MGTLHVRDLDDEIIARLKVRAREHGRSAEAEHRAILAEALRPDQASFDELAARLRELTKGRVHTPSEVLQRESRDER